MSLGHPWSSGWVLELGRAPCARAFIFVQLCPLGVVNDQEREIDPQSQKMTEKLNPIALVPDADVKLQT